MATSFHINGPALIFRGAGYAALSGGTPGAIAQVGISVDGVQVEPADYYEAILADTGGRHVPVAEQAMGMDAVLSFRLEIYDEAVLALIRKRPGQATEGLLEAIGRVMPATDYHRIFIDSPSEGQPYNFPTCRPLRRPHKVGTTRSVFDIQMYAFAYIGTVNDATGAVLYDRVTTGKP